MSIKNNIRNTISKSKNAELAFFKVRSVREAIARATISDYKYISRTYKERFHEDINLANPQTLGEKLQWLKLFYRDDIMPICSDKYAVRSYLKEREHEDLLNELLGVYTDARDIDFNALPNKFVAKATHGSSWNVICTDKSKLDWRYTQKLLNAWLKLNCYTFGREWNYKEMTPRIVVEKFIEHQPLHDYKLMCYNGEPLYMQLNNELNGTAYVDFYTLNTWEKLPVSYAHYEHSKRLIEKPKQLRKMMKLVKELSKPFPFVRVDFYAYDKEIIFGELTFFPSSGLWPIAPRELGYDITFGEPLKLPEPNYNLELLSSIVSKTK